LIGIINKGMILIWALEGLGMNHPVFNAGSGSTHLRQQLYKS